MRGVFKMAKVKRVGSIKEFMAGDHKKPQLNNDYILIGKIIGGAATVLIYTAPTVAAAAGAGGGEFLYKDIMALFDKGVVLVIVFAGAAWGLGHRTKALEILIGVCCGYLLARHAVEIRDYLKGV
jgi:hypothetical protein